MSAAWTMSKPSNEWRFITSYSASVSRLGLLRIASGTPILANVVQQAAEPHAGQAIAVEAELGGDHRAQLRHGLAVAAGVGILGVGGARERAGQRAAVVLVLGVVRGARAGLHVRAVDGGVLVDALRADEREVGLAPELVLGAQLERLGDARRHGERDAVVAGLGCRPQSLDELH